MKPWVLPALGVLAVAVAIENIIYFQPFGSDASLADGAGEWEEEDEDGDESFLGDEGDSRRKALEPTPEIEIARYLASLPMPAQARDPFHRLTGITSGPDTARNIDVPPQLEGTLFSHLRRVAWLDGRPVSEGDFVGRFKVLRIEPDFVLVTDQLRELRLEVSSAPPDTEQDATNTEADAATPAAPAQENES